MTQQDEAGQAGDADTELATEGGLVDNPAEAGSETAVGDAGVIGGGADPTGGEQAGGTSSGDLQTAMPGYGSDSGFDVAARRGGETAGGTAGAAGTPEAGDS